MGLWKFIFGGLTAKVAVDRLNPPTIIFRNREYVCKGISPNFFHNDLIIEVFKTV